MKLLVTGSRDWPWDQRLRVFSYLNRASVNASSVTLLHGACPYGTEIPWCGLDGLSRGVDGLAELHGRLKGWDVQGFPPDRSQGRRGFAIRNAAMVDQKPDKVLAFFLRGAENRGTRMIVDMAKRKNLWVLEIESD